MMTVHLKLFIITVCVAITLKQTNAAAVKIAPSSATCNSFANKAFKEFLFLKYAKALYDFDTALLYCSGSKDTLAQIYTYRAATEIGLSKYKNALNDCDAALKLNNRRGDSYLFKGAAEVYLGDYQAAINDENEASAILDKTMDSIKLHLDIDILDCDLFYVQNYELFKKYNPQIGSTHNLYDVRYGIKYNLLDPKHGLLNVDTFYTTIAENELSVIARGKPHGQDYSLANLYYWIGYYYSELNNPDSSTQYYTKAISADSSDVNVSHYPSSGDFYEYRGDKYFSNADFELAIKDYSKAIDLFRHKHDNIETTLYEMRGECEAKLKRYEKAIDDETTAITFDNNDFEAYCDRGRYYLLLNKKPEAKLDFEKIISADTSLSSEYHPYNAEVDLSYLFLGDTAQAISFIITPDINDAIFNLEYGRVFEAPSCNVSLLISTDYYMLSRLLALINKQKESIHYLEIALACGINKRQALSEPDLDNIKNTSAFKELMKEY